VPLDSIPASEEGTETMEASGTPTPPPRDPEGSQAAPPPPPPPSPPPTDDDRAGGGWRALGFVLALALLFACAVMAIAMADIGDTPTCEAALEDPSLLGADRECFEESEGRKTATLVLGWPSAALAGIAALVAFYFVFTGRRGRLLLTLTGAAVVLGALSILVGSI
jgi:hypothetical protein